MAKFKQLSSQEKKKICPSAASSPIFLWQLWIPDMWSDYFMMMGTHCIKNDQTLNFSAFFDQKSLRGHRSMTQKCSSLHLVAVGRIQFLNWPAKVAISTQNLKRQQWEMVSTWIVFQARKSCPNQNGSHPKNMNLQFDKRFLLVDRGSSQVISYQAFWYNKTILGTHLLGKWPKQ